METTTATTRTTATTTTHYNYDNCYYYIFDKLVCHRHIMLKISMHKTGVTTACHISETVHCGLCIGVGDGREARGDRPPPRLWTDGAEAYFRPQLSVFDFNVSNGVETNFGVGVGEATPEGPRAGGWEDSWGWDSQPLPTN